MLTNMKKTYCIVETSSNCANHQDCWKEIIGTLKAKGWHSSTNPKKSGIILLKECCMTTKEIDRAIKDIADLAKKGVQAEIFLGECLSRTKPFIEVVKKKLPQLKLHTFTTSQEFFLQLNDYYDKPKELTLSVAKDNSAIINIANGCNRKCSFCKVSYMDLPLKSVPMKIILQKIKIAKSKGIRKVVLNAMNSTQYNDNGKHFQDLLEAVLEIPDVYYQINGIVMAELTDRALELLRDRRFFSVQVEVQTFIPEVRKHMNVGEISPERILHIFEQLRGKQILSNLIVGAYREKDRTFQEQLDLIQSNNLFFLSVIDLIPTPGTPSATMNNPSCSKAKERIIKATRVLTRLRSDLAKQMIGKEQTCMVISENIDGHAMLLSENGVLIRTKASNLLMGQILDVVPKQVEGLFYGENQLLILSTEEKSDKKMFGEETMWSFMCTMMEEQLRGAKMTEGFNRNNLSLETYCEKKLSEELNKNRSK